MTRRGRVEYLIAILCVFISAALIYGFIGYTALSGVQAVVDTAKDDLEDAIEESGDLLDDEKEAAGFFMQLLDRITSFDSMSIAIVYGCIAGYMIAWLLSSIILGANFFIKGKLWLRIVGALLWPISLLCITVACFFCLIPHFIYNIVMIFVMGAEKKKALAAAAAPAPAMAAAPAPAMAAAPVAVATVVAEEVPAAAAAVPAPVEEAPAPVEEAPQAAEAPAEEAPEADPDEKEE